MRRKRNSCLAAIEHARKAHPFLELRELIVFLYICENEGINIRELAQLAALDPSTASRCVKRLSSAALLGSAPNARDLRGRVVELTDAGRELREVIDRLIAAAQPIATAS